MTGLICGILMVVVSITLASAICHALDKRQRLFHDSGEVARELDVAHRFHK